MPITNIVIIVFLLAMVYMGTVQGLFSSFLHLLVVIAAGTIAYAVWEPLTVKLLLKYTPLFAWTLGLLVPFGLILLILRMVSDKLIPLNAQFAGVVELVGSIVCGGLSGILTAGIVIIGVGFLPISPDLAGYQPYSIGASGAIQETDSKLWVPVNKYANNFFAGLSRGAFATRTPLAEYKPDLDVQMSLNRVRPENISTIASPDAVSVGAVYQADTAALKDLLPKRLTDVIGSKLTQAGAKVVIVDTDWKTVQGTVDADRALRLPASQVRLIAKPKDTHDKTVELLGPVGFTKTEGDNTTFYPYDSGSQVAFSSSPQPAIGFVFVVPQDLEPLFPQVRLLRLNMPDPNQIKTKPDEVVAAIGVPPEPKQEDEDQADNQPPAVATGTTNVSDASGLRAGSYVLAIEETTKLPLVASKNTVSGISYTDGDNGALITSGSEGSARKPSERVGARNKIIGFEVSPYYTMVRVEVKGDQNTSLFGSGISAAAALNTIFLEDAKGDMWYIAAWVWLKSDKTQEIHYDDFNPVKSAKQMPISRMDKEDKFYLYFMVKKPATLVRYSIGDVSDQQFEPPLQVK